jgi:hypothetical protein
MSGLLGPDGRPIKSIENKKAAPPKLGEGFGAWAGRDLTFGSLPGGGIVQFDLSKLTLADFRSMRDHYQVNSSLAVLSFMQHQSDWHIECEDKKIAAACEVWLREIWTELNASMATANWAGYAPNALSWENDANKREIVINKVKDLVPEECQVKWDFVEGYAPPGRVKPKIPVYGGIRQQGQSYPIPVDNSFWYPLLMENGDYYGRKLLRPAFTSWFFSILVHLFANRYYERFGEPVPVGRAPFDENIEINGSDKPGQTFMLEILQALRSRSAVVLPNDSFQDTHGRINYDYQIEYLESQMRGADFERYLTRLDEEISIGLFTPILLLRTADVGSYNLGVGHMQMYLWMLNAMNDDRARYINKYILRKMANFNFSEKAPDPKIVFRKLGNNNAEMLKDIVQLLLQQNKIKLDLAEIGQMTGMTLKEVKQTLDHGKDNPDDPSGTGTGGNPAPPGGGRGGDSGASGGNVAPVVKEIINRVRPQVENAFRTDSFGPDTTISMGFKRRLEQVLKDQGRYDPIGRVGAIYDYMDSWLTDFASIGQEEYSGPEAFMESFSNTLCNQLAEFM